jgi:hypothetical protein
MNDYFLRMRDDMESLYLFLLKVNTTINDYVELFYKKYYVKQINYINEEMCIGLEIEKVVMKKLPYNSF